MGTACGKWSEVAACVQTSEAGLRIRWCTVMDTAAASPSTKVTLAAASASLYRAAAAQPAVLAGRYSCLSGRKVCVRACLCECRVWEGEVGVQFVVSSLRT